MRTFFRTCSKSASVRLLLSGLVLTSTSASVPATCRVRHVAVVQKEVAVVKEVAAVVATFVPVAVAIPTYSVGYAAAPAVAPAVAHGEAAAVAHKSDCERKLEEVTARLAAIEAKLTNPVKALDIQSPALSLFSAKCANCHDTSKAKANGNGFTLLTGGKIADLTPEQVNKVITMTYSGKMPKKPANITQERFDREGKLTDSDFGVVMDWATTYKVKK